MPNSSLFTRTIMDNMNSSYSGIKKQKTEVVALINAIENGNTGMVQHLLKSIDVRQKITHSYKLLHTAILAGKYDIIQLLIRSGCDVNAKGEEDKTPLHLATENCDAKTVELLLKFGSDVNARDKSGDIPLHSAATLCVLIVELLLKYGGDVNAKAKNGDTPLICAVVFGTENIRNIVEVLLDYGAEINDTCDDKYTALHYAALKGQNDVVELLLKRGCNIDAVTKYERNTPLHCAAEEAYFEVTNTLLQYGCSPDPQNACGQTPLFLAASCPPYDYTLIPELLLKYGSDINHKESIGMTMLHVAANDGCVQNVELFLKNGCDVNTRCSLGTPLYLAVNCDRSDIVEFLLKEGADPNLVTANGEIHLLKIAMEKGYRKIAKLLLLYGYDNLDFLIDNHHPLHWAVRENETEIVNILLSCRTDINCVDSNGFTPLQNAVVNTNHEREESIAKHIIIKETLIEHAIKLDVAGQYVSKQNLEAIPKDDENENLLYFTNFTKFREDCKNEIQTMKCRKIIFNLTLYDLMTKHTSYIAKYGKHENIYKVIKSEEFYKYPIYCDFLIDAFFRFAKRKLLLEKGELEITDIFSVIGIPQVPLRIVLDYLSDHSLRRLTENSKT